MLHELNRLGSVDICSAIEVLSVIFNCAKCWELLLRLVTGRILKVVIRLMKNEK